ncbi:MAG TPA: potassium channel family protein, partial [Candidatus Dormibacteraeota bacterium]|nr:potassium channel family protein [Candidatus Dormibacteraeota bacterium]
MIELAALVLGLLLLGLTGWDIFETIVVPRPTPGVFRFGRYIVRGGWRAVRAIGVRGETRRERLLGLFAPAVTVVLLGAWVVGLTVGFGLVLYGLRDELRPASVDLGTAIYFGATSVLTLGFGDVVPAGGIARFVVAAAALSGLGTVALVVTFLFSLYASYQRREVAVVTLQAKAGAPPSAVVLLESLARLELIERLPDFLGSWETWIAEVLDSHVAYPLLGFFRSSHDDVSWISALGTVLDTSSLVLTTIEDVPRGQAELVKKMGAHLVEDLTNLGFGTPGPDGVDRESFDAVHERLAAAGYRLVPAEEAWPRFRRARSSYAERLESLAAYWAVPPAAWFSGRRRLHSPAVP